METGEIVERVLRSVMPRGSDIAPILLPIEWERQIEAVAPGLDRRQQDDVLGELFARLAKDVFDQEFLLS